MDRPVTEGAFVIQFHQSDRGDHYDFMLESGPVLTTFQLPCTLADIAPDEPVPVTRLADHRREYLTYEGPVSRGRGCVRIVDRGRYQAAVASDDQWVFTVGGDHSSGAFEVSRVGGDEFSLRRKS